MDAPSAKVASKGKAKAKAKAAPAKSKKELPDFSGLSDAEIFQQILHKYPKLITSKDPLIKNILENVDLWHQELTKIGYRLTREEIVEIMTWLGEVNKIIPLSEMLHQSGHICFDIPSELIRIYEIDDYIFNLTEWPNPIVAEEATAAKDIFKKSKVDLYKRDALRRKIVFQQSLLFNIRSSKKASINPACIYLSQLNQMGCRFRGGSIEDLIRDLPKLDNDVDVISAGSEMTVGLFAEHSRHSDDHIVPYSEEKLTEIFITRLRELKYFLQEGDLLDWNGGTFFVSKKNDEVFLTSFIDKDYFPPEAESFLRLLKPRTGRELSSYYNNINFGGPYRGFAIGGGNEPLRVYRLQHAEKKSKKDDSEGESDESDDENKPNGFLKTDLGGGWVILGQIIESEETTQKMG